MNVFSRCGGCPTENIGKPSLSLFVTVMCLGRENWKNVRKTLCVMELDLMQGIQSFCLLPCVPGISSKTSTPEGRCTVCLSGV